MGLLIYILLLLVIVIVLSFLRIRFDVEYQRRGKDDNLVVKMTLLRGLVHYKTEVPTIELENRFFTPVLKMANEMEKAVFHPVDEKELKVGVPFTLSLIRRMPSFLGKGWQRFDKYNSALYYLFRFISCRRLYWRTEIGLGDAAYTGVFVGVIWGVKSFLYQNFRSKIGFMQEKPAISVKPDFFQKKLVLDFNCIFDIRLGHIIIAGLNFVRYALKRL